MALTDTQIELIRTGVRTREETPHSTMFRGIDRVEINVQGGCTTALARSLASRWSCTLTSHRSLVARAPVTVRSAIS